MGQLVVITTNVIDFQSIGRGQEDATRVDMDFKFLVDNAKKVAPFW